MDLIAKFKTTRWRAALSVAVLFACLFGCGKPVVDTRIRSKVPARSVPLPGVDNIDAWWSSWDKKTFLIGIVEDGHTPSVDALTQSKAGLSRALIDGLVDVAALGTLRRRDAEKALAQALSLERQALFPDTEDLFPADASASAPAQVGQPQISTYFLSVRALGPALNQLVEMGLPLAAPVADLLQQKSGIQMMMRSLERADPVEWVEPNLVGYLPPMRRQADGAGSGLGLAPEFKYNTSIISVMKRIRADSAFTFVEKTKPKLSSVTVAVLDTGVDSSHPELKDQMFVNPGETQDGADNDNNCFVDDIFGIDATVECGVDDSVVPRPGHADLGGPGKQCPRVRGDDELSANCGHGTHVAGIVAAKQGGDLSTIGVCPSCRILSIRVAERCLQPETSIAGECRRPMSAYDPLSSYEVDGGISDASQVRALTYLYNLRAPDNRNRLLVNVVNLSLGKYFASRSMSYIIRNLQRKNIIVVAAAGNDGTETPSYPAAYDSVVSVCATSEEYSKGPYGRAPFSNFGDWVDICAPGTDIVSTTPGKTFDGGGLFIDKSGTSQATPFVAGALGYLASYYGNDKSAAQLIEMLKNAADSESLYNSPSNRVPGTGDRLYRACYTDTSNCDNLLGAGFLDLDAAMQGRMQSKTNFNFLTNQPGGCVVSSVASRRALAPQQTWGMILSSMPVGLFLFWLFFRFTFSFWRVNRARRWHR